MTPVVRIAASKSSSALVGGAWGLGLNRRTTSLVWGSESRRTVARESDEAPMVSRALRQIAAGLEGPGRRTDRAALALKNCILKCSAPPGAEVHGWCSLCAETSSSSPC